MRHPSRAPAANLQLSRVAAPKHSIPPLSPNHVIPRRLQYRSHLPNIIHAHLSSVHLTPHIRPNLAPNNDVTRRGRGGKRSNPHSGSRNVHVCARVAYSGASVADDYGGSSEGIGCARGVWGGGAFSGVEGIFFFFFFFFFFFGVVWVCLR